MSFQIKNWPIGFDRGYLQLLDSELFFETTRIPVISYKEEDEFSLDVIKQQTSKRVAGLMNLMPPPGRVSVALMDVLYSGLGGLMLGLMGGIPGAAIGIVVPTLVIENWYDLSRKRYAKKQGKRANALSRLNTNPLEDLFVVYVDKQLEEINRAIEQNGSPLILRTLTQEDYSGMREVVYNFGDALSPSAKSVYGQLIGAYEGYLSDSTTVRL